MPPDLARRLKFIQTAGRERLRKAIQSVIQITTIYIQYLYSGLLDPVPPMRGKTKRPRFLGAVCVNLWEGPIEPSEPSNGLTKLYGRNTRMSSERGSGGNRTLGRQVDNHWTATRPAPRPKHSIKSRRNNLTTYGLAPSNRRHRTRGSSGCIPVRVTPSSSIDMMKNTSEEGE